MTAKIIDGRAYAKALRLSVADRVARCIHHGITPRLDVLLAGSHGPSEIYVRYKLKAAAEIGVNTQLHRFDNDVTTQVLAERIHALNMDESCHGILIQLPLPASVSTADTWTLISKVNPEKDVDGLHPFNQGNIGLSQSGFIACTPYGCLHLLKSELGSLRGKRAVVIGRSRIVGRPMAALLCAEDATVTLCHSRTQSLAEEVKRADIVVAAAGVPGLVRGDWLKSDATVIDVGIHRGEDGKLMGDVRADEAMNVVAALTPVPGGVGPMTIASLMSNVCLSAERRLAI